jgi:hypothetical protein
MFDHYATKEILKQYGVKLVSITENLGDNPEGQLAEGMKAAFNQYYSDRLSFVVKRRPIPAGVGPGAA